MQKVLLVGSALAVLTTPIAAHAQVAGPPAAATGNEAAEQTAAGSGEPGESGGLADIVVTAQRRSENLQNVPIAITAIGADKLNTGAPLGIEDLNSLAPGLNITLAGGNQLLPRLRGVGITSGGIGLENPVAVYVDGVYFSSPRGSLLSLGDVSQIAVLKGPQGTLFGRNATGGVIQITTREPSRDLTLDGQVGYGNRDTILTSLYASGGVAENVMVALAVNYNDQRDGFGTNLFNGQPVNRSKDFAIRGKIKVDLGATTTLRLAGDHAYTVASQPAYRIMDGKRGTGGVGFTGDTYDIDSDLQPLAQVRQDGISLTINQKLSSLQLTSISAYRRVIAFNTLDSDYSTAPTTAVANNTAERQVSQEFQLTNGAGPLTWTTGLFYFWSSGRYEPTKVTTAGGTVSSLVTSQAETRSIAGYAQGTYEVARNLKLTAGLRYTYDQQSLTAQAARQTLTAYTVTGSGFDKSSNKRLTWRFAADYRLSDEALLYALYSRGTKSAGYNAQTLPTPAFQPETLDDYEAGLKTDLFDRHLRLNFAGYYYNYRDLQVSSYPNGILTIANAANAILYGADIDLAAIITPRLSLTGGVSYLHGRYENFPRGQLTIPIATGGNTITFGDDSGKHLTLSPDWTFNAGADYTIALGDSKLLIHADYYHNSGWFPTADNRVKQPAYDLVNAFVLLTINNRYIARLWGRNLLNKAYASQITIGGAGDAIALAPGRTFGMTLGVRLGAGGR